MRLTYGEFERAINRYREMSEKETQMSNVMGLMVEWPGNDWIYNFYEFISDMCDFTEEEKSEPDGTWLDYWVFTLDFGTQANKCPVILNSGKTVYIRTIKNLWDMITKGECDNED